MSKIDDMALFVRVVKAGGLAAAGRRMGLSPASMTVRINALEARYDTRLLNRTTRSITLTDAGRRFYEACLRVLAEVADAEALLREEHEGFSGPLRVTATSDFGRQFVAPALAEFVKQYPDVEPYLYLTESVINLAEQGFDLGIRLGNLPDSNLVVRRLAENHRVLCASPSYLQQCGVPTQPEDLLLHRCLVLTRLGEPLSEWHFKSISNEQTFKIKVKAAMMSNDGALIRQWALAGSGIAIKSIWDIKRDLASGHLVTVLNDFQQGMKASDHRDVGLQLVYPERRYLPRQVAGFATHLQASLA